MHRDAGAVAVLAAVGRRLFVPLLHGNVLAGYTIERLLGVGGMGAVYLARDPRSDRSVALKVFNDAFAAREQGRTAFAREAGLLAGLDHPNIVGVADHSGSGDEQLWIAMEFIDGIDAARLIVDGGALPPERAVELITQAADGLAHAHTAGVVHRDVKPANLLVEPSDSGDERVLVTDFGIARALGETATAGNMTATFAYAAPERFQDAPIDERADVYSLGCTLFEFLTGQPPFPRNDPAAVMMAHLFEPAPPVSAIRPELPAALDAVLATALAKDPAERYADCRAFANAARLALTTTDSPSPAALTTGGSSALTTDGSSALATDGPSAPTVDGLSAPTVDGLSAPTVDGLSAPTVHGPSTPTIDGPSVLTAAGTGVPPAAARPVLTRRPRVLPVSLGTAAAATLLAGGVAVLAFAMSPGRDHSHGSATTPAAAPQSPATSQVPDRVPVAAPAQVPSALTESTPAIEPVVAEDVSAAAHAQCQTYVLLVQQNGLEGALATLEAEPSWALATPAEQAIAREAVRLAARGECS
ncbi:protein kinase [Nocardia yamanashiensis]|uniref:serine/threonine-protein kinase n=1 Tax=Nocardia yamanashiensis TaxID=209247 RepID=UPI001E5708CD|nr:serine/threonine-protein kinase [Nocardia yamanashiensis]UGT43685.1 protein kinase [Nocardia yamanashiensis]